MNTYITDVRRLLQQCGCASDVYERIKPVKIPGSIHPLTPGQRRHVDAVSRERGYRRFVVTHMQG